VLGQVLHGLEHEVPGSGRVEIDDCQRGLIEVRRDLLVAVVGLPARAAPTTSTADMGVVLAS
jgi:hypothetical protein